MDWLDEAAWRDRNSNGCLPHYRGTGAFDYEITYWQLRIPCVDPGCDSSADPTEVRKQRAFVASRRHWFEYT